MQVEFSILGGDLVTIGGAPLEVTASKQRALLSILLLNAGTPVTSERLRELLWRRSQPATAAKNLQVLVGRLRRHIEPGSAGDWAVLRSFHGGYVIDTDACRIDAIEFESAVTRAQLAARHRQWEGAAGALRSALADWHAEPLQEFGYEEWAVESIARLTDLRLDAEELLIEAELALHGACRSHARIAQLVDEHPFRERLRGLQMRALYLEGRQADALQAYRAARGFLRDELGIEPGPELRDLHRRILEQDPSLDLRFDAPPRPRLPTLPGLTTSTIGRSRERAEVLDVLERGTPRIVTITGWGGTGKTRLAIEVAAHVPPGAWDDVAFIDLTSATLAEQVPSVFEAAFGINAGDTEPIDAVAQAIGMRRLLIVVDNFEHVLGASGFVAALCRRCANVTFLVTTREALRIHGEHEFRLGPLPLPSATQVTGADPGLLENDALRLFAERAADAGSSRVLDGTNAGHVAELCRRLDGLPLAIELAAARSRLLTPEQILARLDRRLDLLTTGATDLPERQRSLRAAIEWSYDLLDEGEQELFRALAVCAGGCTVETAVAIAAEGSSEFEVLDRLESLVDKHLLVREVDAAGDVRLTLLETIALFARAQLDGDPGAHSVRRRHAEAMLALGQAGNTHRGGAENDRARLRVSLDITNLHAAAEWALTYETKLAGAIVGSLIRHYSTTGHVRAGLALVAPVADRCADLALPDAVDVLYLAGRLSQQSGSNDAAVRYLSQSIAWSHDSLNHATLARALIGLGDAHLHAEEFEKAANSIRTAIEIAQRHNLDWLVGWGLTLLGLVHFDTDGPNEAELTFGEARTIFDQEGDSFWRIHVAMNLALVQLQRGRAREGLRELATAARDAEANGFFTLLAHVTSNEIRFLLELGEFERACDVSDRTIELAQASGNAFILCYSTTLRAYALTNVGRLEEAFDAVSRALSIAQSSRWYRFAHYGNAIMGRLLAAAGYLQEALDVWLLLDADQLHSSYVMDRAILLERKTQASELAAVLNVEAATALSSEDALDAEARLSATLRYLPLLGSYYDRQ